MKKKIVHFIFNLGRGGAETMMVRVIKELPEYQHGGNPISNEPFW